MITPRGALSFAALGATAAFTFWVLQISAPREVRTREAHHDPDLTFSQPRITSYGPDGTLSLNMTAASAVHYPDDDSVALEQLQLDLRTKDGARWTMVAAHGLAPMKGDTVTLQGGVRISRPQQVAKAAGQGAAPSSPVELRTERATLNTHAQRIETVEPVEMIQGKNRTTAVGLIADLEADHITFMSHVRGTYVMR